MDPPGLIRPHEDKLWLVQRLLDAAVVFAAYGLSCALWDHDWHEHDSLAVGAAVVVFWLSSEANGLYRSWRAMPVRQEARAVLASWVFAVPVLLLLAFASKTSEDYSRLVTGTWFVVAPALLLLWKGGFRLALHEMRAHGRNTRGVAIVGATETGIRLAVQILEQPWTGLRLRGFYDDRDVSRRIAVPMEVGEVRGDLHELVERARRGEVDIVYVALPLRAETRMREVIADLADTTVSVYVVADFFSLDLLRAEWSTVGDVPVVSVVESPFDDGIDAGIKRGEDLVLGTLIMLLIAVPMAVIALAVKLTSPGPALFKQRRYGLNGEEIEVYKFRTMRVCEDGDAIAQATKDDPRVTPLGAFLRRTSLDELPQFLNVLKGDMSIVGPRPHAVAHNEEYRRLIHRYMIRHKVKPGITGWAQVNGWRGETDTVDKMEQRVQHDLEYIRRWSLSWDLEIIFLTVFGSSARRNAY